MTSELISFPQGLDSGQVRGGEAMIVEIVNDKEKPILSDTGSANTTWDKRLVMDMISPLDPCGVDEHHLPTSTDRGTVTSSRPKGVPKTSATKAAKVRCIAVCLLKKNNMLAVQALLQEMSFPFPASLRKEAVRIP